MATYWENSCSFGLRYVSWYKYLIVILVFSHLGFWSGNLFLIAPFPDLCLLVPFCIICVAKNKGALILQILGFLMQRLKFRAIHCYSFHELFAIYIYTQIFLGNISLVLSAYRLDRNGQSV